MHYYSNGKEVLLPHVGFRIATMRPRRGLRLQVVLTLSFLSLFCCLFVIFSTMRQMNRDDLLRDSEVNNYYNGFPSLDNNPREGSEMKRNIESKHFDHIKDRGRSLQSFPRLKTWKNNNHGLSSFEQIGVKENRLLSCGDIKDIRVVGNIGHGYTKIVQKGVYKGVEVAIKSVQPDSVDIKDCISNPAVNRSIEECFILSKYKLVKEIIMLQELQHANIVKLLGFCWQNELNTADLQTRGLTMVTEIGDKLDVIVLVQLPWQERLRICVGLARLLHYLAHSPLGSLIIRDFKVTQFILVSGEIKLTDFDDVDNKEPACSSSDGCVVQTAEGSNKTLPCDRGQCRGFNAAKNLADISRFFFRHILLPGAPEKLKGYLKEIKDNVQTLSWDSQALVQYLERVVELLITGKHFSSGTFPKTNVYRQVSDADFPNMHDYNCADSRSFDACELAVYSDAEAKYMCDKDKRCKAFVMTTKTLWSGYTIVYLKNKTTDVKPNKDTTVYVKLPT